MIDIEEVLGGEILWQMSAAERATIFYLFGKMPSRRVAIEVGSFKGGFTHVLSRHFEKVYSLDIDHRNIVGREQLANVEWVTGDSATTLPALIDKINRSRKEHVDFVLIDGDHAFGAVLSDINSVLRLRPRDEVVVLLHDSWYKPTRDAINVADWNGCPFVHLVEKDFVAGDLVGSASGNVFVGGLALVRMSPARRAGAIEIGQRHDFMYRMCLEGLELRAAL